MTARVKGLPEGRYRAREAMAKGLYWGFTQKTALSAFWSLLSRA